MSAASSGPDPVASLPPLREVIARHELNPRRSLGQNFLLDLNLTGRIARSAGDLTQGTTIEIGPGPGGLTRALLLAGAGRVVAVEKDERCAAALSEVAAAADGRLTVVCEDALQVDLAAIGPPPRRIVANLPYNVATPLLLRWLSAVAQAPDVVETMTLMFQKEVAQRLVAPVRSEHYGRLSVITQWLCEAHLLFDIAPSAFVPPPKVTSTVVQLRPRPTPAAQSSLQGLERVTAAAFGQRRKMLRQSLKPLGTDPAPLLERAGIEPTRRAEELSVADFCRLARILEGGD